MKKYERLTDCPVIKVLFESSMSFQLTTTMKMGISNKIQFVTNLDINGDGVLRVNLNFCTKRFNRP